MSVEKSIRYSRPLNFSKMLTACTVDPQNWQTTVSPLLGHSNFPLHEGQSITGKDVGTPSEKKATDALKIVVQLLKKLVYYRLTRTSNVVNRSMM